MSTSLVLLLLLAALVVFIVARSRRTKRRTPNQPPRASSKSVKQAIKPQAKPQAKQNPAESAASTGLPKDSSSPAEIKADLLEVASPKGGAFDPDATQVYRRASPAPVSPTSPKREGSAIAVASLVGLSGSQRGRSFPVSAEGITIGRSPTCEVVLEDSRVSLRHAWVGIIDGKAVLRDLESTNGTFLNTASTSPVATVELCTGDTIFFGGHQGDQFRFRASGTPLVVADDLAKAAV